MKIIAIIPAICLIFVFAFSDFVAADEANARQIKILNQNGQIVKSLVLQNFPWNRVGDFAVADLGKDNIPEIIVAAPEKEKPKVLIYRQDGSLMRELLVFPENYLGGVNLEIADMDQNGFNDLIVAATKNGGPHLRILAADGKELNSFFAFDRNFTGGINVAAGDLNGDSKTELAVSTNKNDTIKIFDYRGSLLKEFVSATGFKNGQRISVGDLGSDGVAEIATYPNSGDRPLISIFDNQGGKLNSFNAFHEKFLGGVNLLISQKKIFASAGKGGGPHLRIMDSFNNLDRQFFTDDLSFLGGIKTAMFNHEIYTLPEIFKTGTMPDQKYIEIDLSEQKLRYFQNGFALNEYTVSSGREDLPTPVGDFSIINKQKLAYSATYNLYMPFWQSFKPKYGLHELPYWAGGYREGENHLGYPVSHGCVRLGVGPAEELFNLTEIGTKVYIRP